MFLSLWCKVVTSISKNTQSPDCRQCSPAQRDRKWARSRHLEIEALESRCLPATGAGSASALLSIQQTAAAESAAAQSINAFALNLYSELQQETGGSGNMILSPYSIATALAMLYAGAGGQTAAQMASVLHLPADPGTVTQDFGALMADLNAAGLSGGNALSVANALWGQQGLPFCDPFLNLLQTDFGAGLQQVDFLNDPEGARQTINNWVQQQTDGKIQDLIPPGELSTLTQLVLTNAIYFHGQWEMPFDPGATSDAAFTLASGDQVQTAMMHSTNYYAYMQSDGFQVLQLPYEGNRLAMDVLLPSQESGLSGLSASSLPADLNGWLDQLSPEQAQEVIVSLPKFEMTTSFQLADPLSTLGMTDAFTPDADFSGIAPPQPVPFYLSLVLHKANIQVDETGTEAAGATALGMVQPIVCGLGVGVQPVVVFDADHPFLYVVRDTQTGSILFMGQVMDPTQDEGNSSAPPIQPGTQDGILPVPSPPGVWIPVHLTAPVPVIVLPPSPSPQPSNVVPGPVPVCGPFATPPNSSSVVSSPVPQEPGIAVSRGQGPSIAEDPQPVVGLSVVSREVAVPALNTAGPGAAFRAWGGSEQFEVASYQPLNLSAGNLGGEAGPGKSLALPLVIPGVSHPQSMADDQEGSSPELEGIYPDGPFDLSTLMEPSLVLVRSDGDEAPAVAQVSSEATDVLED